jgi:hypothetical protein
VSNRRISKDHVVGFLFGVGLGLLFVAKVSWADPISTSYRPNTGISTDAKAMMGAQRLFRVEDCEVWGFNWRNADRVVAVCPGASTKSAAVDVKPVITVPAPGR